MPKLATWLNSDSKPVSHADKRLANRFLKYWEELRGDQDFPLISDLNLDHLGEFVPYIFNIDLSFGTDDPEFRFLGRQLVRDCGGDITNQGISRLLPRSCLARAVGRRGEVTSEGKPCMIADEFVDADGNKVFYRAVMMPFSSTGDTIDFIIGAINSKTVKLSRAAAPAPPESEAASASSDSRGAGAAARLSSTVLLLIAPMMKSIVSPVLLNGIMTAR